MKDEFLDLGKQPIANAFLEEKTPDNELFYNLIMSFDRSTKLVSQTEPIDSDLMFNDSYPYRGSMSKTMTNHFKNLSLNLPDSLNVLEIGSNDGVFIKNRSAKNTISVEPCKNFAEETSSLGYKTYCNFWNNNLSKQIKSEKGEQDVIFAANCICHIPDLHDCFSSVELLLAEDGQFIFEDPSLLEMINNNSYDQIYDEHIHIFSVIALDNLLKQHGLQVSKVENLSVHGGSNRIYAKKIGAEICPSVDINKSHEKLFGLDGMEAFNIFAKKVAESKQDLNRFLNNCAESGKKVISYGATSKSTTIFNYCDIDESLIKYIVDTTPEKQNRFSPGKHIPIIKPDEGFNNSIDIAFLGAWNFAEEIRKKEKNFKGKFLTHVPSIRIF
jgi:methylation protein EvaC